MTALQLIALLQTKLEENGRKDFVVFVDTDLNSVGGLTDLTKTTIEQSEYLGFDENFVYTIIKQELL